MENVTVQDFRPEQELIKVIVDESYVTIEKQSDGSVVIQVYEAHKGLVKTLTL